MELTMAEKKLLSFVTIQSGDISVHRSFYILLQPSAVPSSSDKWHWNRDALSQIVELSRLSRKQHHLIEILHVSYFAAKALLSILQVLQHTNTTSTPYESIRTLASREINGYQFFMLHASVKTSWEINSSALLTKCPDLWSYQIYFVIPGSAVWPLVLLCCIRRSNCRLEIAHPCKDFLVQSWMHLIPQELHFQDHTRSYLTITFAVSDKSESPLSW